MDAVADTPAEQERDPWAAARETCAERYFQRDLEDQRRWYGERPSRFKVRAQALGITVVAAGAATSFLQVAVVVLARTGGRSPATTRAGPPTGWPASR